MATYRAWLEDAGLEVTEQDFVPEGDGGHALFWARLQELTRSGVTSTAVRRSRAITVS